MRTRSSAAARRSRSSPWPGWVGTSEIWRFVDHQDRFSTFQYIAWRVILATPLGEGTDGWRTALASGDPRGRIAKLFIIDRKVY
jgi:hypothetical protein